MRYKDRTDLPDTLQEALPEAAQDSYLEAYNRAWEEYDENMGGDMSRQSVAHQQGMFTVQNEFEQDSNGNWHRKGDDTEDQSPMESVVESVKNTLMGD